MGRRNVISFSLFNAVPLYLEGARENAELAHTVYPGWKTRFYVDHTVPAELIGALVERQAEIVVVEGPRLGPQYGRFWRLWIAADADVDRFIVRDVDSRLNSREKAAVDAWIASGRSFHLMRDAFAHNRKVLSGMWGGRGSSVPNMRELTDAWGAYEIGDNDRFMSTTIFSLMGTDYLCHDSLGHFGDGTPFPSHAKMSGTSFVGEIVDDAVKDQDVWRLVGELRDDVARLNQQAETHRREIETCRRLVNDLQMPDAPRSLRLVLPIARLLRSCSLAFQRRRSS